MNVLMNDFSRDPAALRAREVSAAQRVLTSGNYILGEEVKCFEGEWAHYLGVNDCAGVGNGMDAIELGLRALGLGAGDEVIIPAVTAFASALAVVRAGATPVIADVHLKNGLLNLESASRCLSSRTKAVILVHLYGQVPDMDLWCDWARENQLYLVEDCAQAHGAAFNGKKVGAFGAFGAWSFYPTKNLGARGDGGAVSSNNAALIAKVKTLRHYGQGALYEHQEIGSNSRLDEMQAAILRERLPWLDRNNQKRRENAAHYRTCLPEEACLLPESAHAFHVNHLFVLVTHHRDALREHLASGGIQTLIHYPKILSDQAALRGVRIDSSGLPDATRFVSSCVSLPVAPHLSFEDVQVVGRSARSWFAHQSVGTPLPLAV